MTKRVIYHCWILCLLCSCAANKSNPDYDSSVDFASYTTYAWSDKTDEQTTKSRLDSPLLHQQVRESIESELNAKGLKKTPTGSADVLLAYHLSVATSSQPAGRVSLGIGRFSGGSSVGLSVGVPVGGRVVEEGTLAIDMIDSKTNSVVWRGFASRKLASQSPSPEQAEAKVDEVVKEILAKYPPGT